MKRMGRRAQYLVARNGTLLGVVGLVVVFTLLNERFLSWRNATIIGQAIAELGIIAIPLALLVIAGSVDLSVGSIASMAAIIAGKVMVSTGSMLAGVVAALGFGIAAGALNGLLVSYLNLNSIVVTLGFLAVWGGMALYISEGQTVSGLPESFTDLAAIKLIGVPIQIYILAAAVILGWVALNKLPYGRRLYAVGGNQRAAFLMGISIRRVRFLMFVGVGVAAAFGGLMLTAKLNAATPQSGQGLELDALTVVLLGGVAFAGGMGRISGVVAGLLFVGVLQNGLVVTGTSEFLQQVFLGLTLIAAVALDDSIRQFAHRSWTEETPPPEAGDASATAGPLTPAVGARAPQ
ncbi:MAG: ribose transport system permease protein [Solirubrobacteraceae bacterium]|nr:ribose transport system permease protein [Solirubrobacteraceae bacterium]